MKKFIYAFAFCLFAFLASSNVAMANDTALDNPTLTVETEKTVLVEERADIVSEDAGVIVIVTDCCIIIIIY